MRTRILLCALLQSNVLRISYSETVSHRIHGERLLMHCFEEQLNKGNIYAPNYCVSELCALSEFINNKKHDDTETRFVSVFG
jgi:hypothetical protein